MKRKNGYIREYVIVSISLLILLMLNLTLGSVMLPPKEIFSSLFGQSTQTFVNEILWDYRIPKAITALLAGVALSVCGLQMQTLFKNPLADPFILGISSGAGLGVALFVMGFSAFGISFSGSVFMNMGIAASAWVGAFAVTLLILLVSSRLRESTSLLIFGIMLGSVQVLL